MVIHLKRFRFVHLHVYNKATSTHVHIEVRRTLFAFDCTVHVYLITYTQASEPRGGN